MFLDIIELGTENKNSRFGKTAIKSGLRFVEKLLIGPQRYLYKFKKTNKKMKASTIFNRF